eukprot:CAMPEP_0119116804 /NCGR_PEP_ID=MMETSP1180-20130426/52490_1 /TAXON_ID=3052 ORGANISM="Chlamydomonas cf sp, Strain CCMP681" /NCGR_SAMPLE_ID=MMETSP1180 /ASSEMBLY_ACC=CAM_ASM_000741 /LENGTH=257 /DNA_ID=CAMNT_0007105995 /DNA_START=1 /DNA_END=774 /DNA_ORIENTATION=-
MMRLASTPLISWAASLHRLAQTSCSGKLCADHRVLVQFNSTTAQVEPKQAAKVVEEPPREMWWKALYALGVRRGDVVQGIVLKTTDKGTVTVEVNKIWCKLPRLEISQETVSGPDAAIMFKTGDVVKALFAGRHLSTKSLEASPGDMLRDPQGVYAGAEEAAKAHRLGVKAERQKRVQRLTASGIKEGDVLQGTVEAPSRKGAVVSLGSGVSGNLRSETAEAVVEHAALKQGDVIKVRVTLCDVKAPKVLLSTNLAA